MLKFHDVRIIGQELKKIGFKNLKEYRESDLWKKRREESINHYPKDRCYFCGIKTEKIQVHHSSYRNLGKEHVYQIKPSCGDCHLWIHAWVMRNTSSANRNKLRKATQQRFRRKRTERLRNGAWW